MYFASKYSGLQVVYRGAEESFNTNGTKIVNKSPGIATFVGGKFVTDDVEVVKQMKSSPAYGSMFFGPFDNDAKDVDVPKVKETKVEVSNEPSMANIKRKPMTHDSSVSK